MLRVTYVKDGGSVGIDPVKEFNERSTYCKLVSELRKSILPLAPLDPAPLAGPRIVNVCRLTRFEKLVGKLPLKVDSVNVREVRVPFTQIKPASSQYTFVVFAFAKLSQF